METEKIQKLVSYKKDPGFAIFNGIEKVGEEVKKAGAKIEGASLVITLDDETIERLKGEPGKEGAPGKTIVGPPGRSIVGPQGPKGDTPVAGEDYPIPKDGKTPKVGVDFFIPDPIPGKQGKPGEKGEDGSPDTGAEIVKKINGLKVLPELQIDWKHIRGFPKNRNDRGGIHRGGQQIAVSDEGTLLTSTAKTINFTGAGVVATTVGDNITVDISSGGGGGGGWETPVGTVDGVNTSYTVSNEPEIVFVDGMGFIDGFGYTYLLGTITMDTPPKYFIRSSF